MLACFVHLDPLFQDDWKEEEMREAGASAVEQGFGFGSLGDADVESGRTKGAPHGSGLAVAFEHLLQTKRELSLRQMERLPPTLGSRHLGASCPSLHSHRKLVQSVFPFWPLIRVYSYSLKFLDFCEFFIVTATVFVYSFRFLLII